MVDNNQFRQQQAARLALSPHLPADKVQLALHMLDGFHLASASGTVAYIRAVAERFQLPDSLRKQLCMDLYAGLEGRVDSAPELVPQFIPEPVIEAARAVAEVIAPAAPLPSAIQLFISFGEGFSRRAQNMEAAVAEDMRESLEQLLADVPDGAALATWPDLVDSGALLQLPKPRLAQLFHNLYLAACDALGPVDADALLKWSIQDAERQGGGRGLSARELL